MFEQLLEAVAAGHGHGDGHGDGGGADVVLDAYDADLDRLLALDPDSLSRDELVAFVARLETHKRRTAVLDHQLIATLQSRGVARELGCPTTATLLSQLLRINPGQARARVAAAAQLGPRRGLLGQQLDAVLPVAARAQRDGVISLEHAQVITDAVTTLPDAVRDVHGDTVEADLVGLASEFTPAQLAVLGRHIHACLNPDGSLADDADHKRRRDLTLAQHADGSGSVRGRLDPETLAALQAVLDSTARPEPAHDGTPDPRSPGQRRHDGLRDALLLALRCGELPEVGGTPVTLVITMTADQVTDHLTHTHTDTDGHGECDGECDSVCDGECENYRDRECDQDCSSDCEPDCDPADSDGDRRGSDTDDNDPADSDGDRSSDTRENDAGRDSDGGRSSDPVDNERDGGDDGRGDRATYGSTAYAATHTTGTCCDSCTDDTDHDELGENTTRARRRHQRYDGGYARTNHGGLIPIADALKLADQAEIITVLFDQLGGVLAYGREKRNADSPMRRVLAARDKGCSMPGCSAPPAWCQPHHVIEWVRGGKTDIRNLTLLCGFHHREYKRLGWVCHMRGGLPYWTPPRWLDPTQTPRLNKAHL
jgi:hypothetical protein